MLAAKGGSKPVKIRSESELFVSKNFILGLFCGINPPAAKVPLVNNLGAAANQTIMSHTFRHICLGARRLLCHESAHRTTGWLMGDVEA